MTKYAEVAVDAPAGYDRTFTYSIPSGISVSPGHLVQVPFGPRVLSGVVFRLSSEPQITETREIARLAYPQSVLSFHELALARWVSDYYMAPLFDCAALMFPPGYSVRANSYLSVKYPTPELKLTTAQGRLVSYLTNRGKVRREVVIRALGAGVETVLGSLTRLGVIDASWEWQRPRVRSKYATYLE
ncbi:MAG: hypothetical protein QGI09_07600, partial [Dehalococcoidia bacterium]|nr:hypothetical protein [Dehalococcoidia bacterium]